MKRCAQNHWHISNRICFPFPFFRGKITELRKVTELQFYENRHKRRFQKLQLPMPFHCNIFMPHSIPDILFYIISRPQALEYLCLINNKDFLYNFNVFQSQSLNSTLTVRRYYNCLVENKEIVTIIYTLRGCSYARKRNRARLQSSHVSVAMRLEEKVWEARKGVL